MSVIEEILGQYDDLAASDANEAATRLKVINDVLYKVLGWTHTDVTVEDRVLEDGVTTFSDYILRTGMSSLVIEAKRVGASFHEVPDTRRANLRGRFISGATGEAITQARDYARKMGIPFAVVTNGKQWIVFPATRTDQITFSNSAAIIFPSLRSALRDDFAEFYDLLSRECVINGSLQAELLGRREDQIEERRLNKFFTKGFSKISRHSLYPLIEDAITTSFSENIVNADPELLERLYVRTPDRMRFDGRIKMHIQKRDSVLEKAAIRPLRDKRSNVINDLILAAARRAKPLAILVLGQVGAGKTTFLEFTRKVGAANFFTVISGKPYPHWVHIDFKKFDRTGDAHAFLVDSIKAYISSDPFLSDYETCLKHAYEEEISALFRGPLFLLSDDEGEKKRRVADLLSNDYQKTSPYVEKVIRYAAGKSSFFLVIDNVDQFEDDDIQSKIFSSAMAFAQSTNCNLVCAMRETTFIRHKNSATFDAFDFDAVAIDAPSVEAVLSKRFFVAKQLLSGKSGQFTAENGAVMKVGNMADIIEMVQASVLGSSIGSIIEILATSDIRLALRMTREFLQSGWTASGKALRIYQETGHYILPAHEALRAIMLGNQPVYHEEFSVLGNPFDSRLSQTNAQLLRLYVLNACVQLSSEAGFRYVEGTEIRDSLRSIGFGDDITIKVITDLCNFRFIHTTSHAAPSIESSFVVSRLGGNILKNFLSNMMYLENVLMDTFIANDDAWLDLKSSSTAIYAERDIVNRLSLRKQRVLSFHSHMSDLYKPLQDESLRRGLPKHWCSNPLLASKHQLDINLEKARGSAERNYKTPS
jgi:hypothetical protein